MCTVAIGWYNFILPSDLHLCRGSGRKHEKTADELDKDLEATSRSPSKPIDRNDGASFHVSAGRLWCSRLCRIIFWEHIASVSFGLRKLFPLPVVISNEKPP